MTTLSSFRLAFQSLKESARFFGAVLKRAWLPLVILHLVEAGADQIFTFFTDRIQATGKEDLTLIAMAVVLQLVFGVAWGAIWTVVFASTAEAAFSEQQTPKATSVLNEALNPVLIESTRSLAAVMFRLPFLILPGFIEYVRLSFVPFIVILNPAYKEGKIDALEESRKLARGHWTLLLLIMVLSLALPSIISSVAQGDIPWAWLNPVGFAIATAITFFINVAFSLFLFAVFRKVFMIRTSVPEQAH